jgi:hypothetical protein
VIDQVRSNGMRILVQYLNQLPATRVLGTSEDDAGESDEMAALLRQELGNEAAPQPSKLRWWVKLTLDIRAHMAWHVVQELGFVLNYISIDERLPTVFMPTSSPPYMNGGPDDYLGWVIESTADNVDPAYIAEVLEGRLPRPVDDLGQWARCTSAPCDVPERPDDDD